MDKNNVVAKNLDCVLIIRNIFKYSSVENNGTYINIKGEWSDHSLLPIVEIFTTIQLKNGNNIFCIYNNVTNTEFTCLNIQKIDNPTIVNQLIVGSDKYVYKLEDKCQILIYITSTVFFPIFFYYY